MLCSPTLCIRNHCHYDTFACKQTRTVVLPLILAIYCVLPCTVMPSLQTQSSAPLGQVNNNKVACIWNIASSMYIKACHALQQQKPRLLRCAIWQRDFVSRTWTLLMSFAADQLIYSKRYSTCKLSRFRSVNGWWPPHEDDNIGAWKMLA